jgi:AraC-like DNA-binding protein
MTKVHLSADDIAKCCMAKTILEKEYANHRSIELLARQVGTNQDKLKKGFKVVYNITIYAFVTSIRIEKAKELLEYTELPIETIAYKLGLDHSNLIKQFKRSTGCTPKDWRKIGRDTDTSYAV